MTATTLPRPPAGTLAPPAHTGGPSPPPLAPRPPQPPVTPRSAGPWRTILALLAAGALAVGTIVWVASRSDTEPGKPGRPARTAPPPVSQAVLTGSYDVAMVTTSAKGWESLSVGDKDEVTWSFSPNGTRLNGAMMGGTWVIVLDRSGANTHGSTQTSLSSCQFTPVTDTLRVQLKVTAGHFVGERWVATRFTGTFRMYSPPATAGLWSCPGSTLTARIIGTRI